MALQTSRPPLCAPAEFSAADAVALVLMTKPFYTDTDFPAKMRKWVKESALLPGTAATGTGGVSKKGIGLFRWVGLFARGSCRQPGAAVSCAQVRTQIPGPHFVGTCVHALPSLSVPVFKLHPNVMNHSPVVCWHAAAASTGSLRQRRMQPPATVPLWGQAPCRRAAKMMHRRGTTCPRCM